MLKLIGSAIGSAIGAGIKALFGWFIARQQRADNIELGQQRATNAQHEASAKADKDMQIAQAGPRGAEVTKKALDDGTF